MRRFMRRLEDAGQLLVIERRVDPKHELAAVTHRVQRTSNEAVLFTDVIGSRVPVVTNLYGSRDRLASIIDADARSFCRAWDARVGAPATGEPATRSEPAVPLERGTLSDLPLVWYSEHDGGPYLTSALYLAKEPGTGVANLSFHRSMVVSDRELRVRLAPRHHLTRYHGKAEEAGRPLEAAILIGAPPPVFLAGASRVPYEEDEMVLAARVAGAPIPTRPCRTIDLEVPAGTEIVIEGRFLPGVRRPEGPFGEFMDYYVPVADNPVFEVTDVSWRPGAIFHSINCGSGEEVLPLGLLAAAWTWQCIAPRLPGIVDVVYHPVVNHMVIGLRQRYEGHAREVLEAAMAAPASCKMCTVVDDDVDIYDLRDVMWAILTRGRPGDGNLRLPPVPSFQKDPQATWGRFGIDACAPYGRREQFARKRIPGGDDLALEDYLPR
jgi:UbiD family decarboxylase